MASGHCWPVPSQPVQSPQASSWPVSLQPAWWPVPMARSRRACLRPACCWSRSSCHQPCWSWSSHCHSSQPAWPACCCRHRHHRHRRQERPRWPEPGQACCRIQVECSWSFQKTETGGNVDQTRKWPLPEDRTVAIHSVHHRIMYFHDSDLPVRAERGRSIEDLENMPSRSCA